ncbi:MAG TPA: hypothetical protein VGO09_03180, partial [Flavisolibacter sp.]|nr:hypothetical protein [Flavisolibacter sp.]
MYSLDILSFHPGRQHNLEQARQINRYFKRFRHFTSLYFNPSFIKRVGKISPFMEKVLGRRSMAFDSRHLIVTHMLPELNLLIKRIIGKKLKYPDFISRNASYQDWLLKKHLPPKICIGYDGSSWKVFESWKNKSFLILDLAV